MHIVWLAYISSPVEARQVIELRRNVREVFRLFGAQVLLGLKLSKLRLSDLRAVAQGSQARFLEFRRAAGYFEHRPDITVSQNIAAEELIELLLRRRFRLHGDA